MLQESVTDNKKLADHGENREKHNIDEYESLAYVLMVSANLSLVLLNALLPLKSLLSSLLNQCLLCLNQKRFCMIMIVCFTM